MDIHGPKNWWCLDVYSGIFRFQPLVFGGCNLGILHMDTCRSKNSALNQHVPFMLSLQHQETHFVKFMRHGNPSSGLISTAYHWWSISTFGVPILLVGIVALPPRRGSTPSGVLRVSGPEVDMWKKLSKTWLSPTPLGSHMIKVTRWLEMVSTHLLDVCFFQAAWDVMGCESSRVAGYPWITWKH